MLRHKLVKSTFILIDPESKEPIGQYRSAQKVFEHLGKCINSGGKVYKNYGAFVKFLGGFNWRKKHQMPISTCGGKVSYQLVFRKEIKMTGSH